MKKILCVLMAVILAASCFGVIGVAAADGYAAKNPITDNFSSYYEFIDENADKKIFGYTYDFLYESTVYTDWSKLDIRFDKGGVPSQSTDGSFALGFGNMNAYLKRVMNGFFLGQKLYTEEYAVALINFFGKLIDPAFEPVTKAFENNLSPNDYDFFETIAVKSGLAETIQRNWCDRGINYNAFFSIFGANVSDIVSSKLNDGKHVAKALVQGAVGSFVAVGPLEYAFGVLQGLSGSYSSVVYDAATALFSRKIAAGKPEKKEDGSIERVNYSVAELNSVQGFLTYALDGIIDYEFFKFPDSRIATASTRTDQQLFLYMYFAINYKYRYNDKFVDGISAKINEFLIGGDRYKSAGYTEEEIGAIMHNISNIIDVVFKGDITYESVEFIQSLTKENIQSTPDDMLGQLRSWFSGIIRKIVDYFDYLFKLLSGDIKYGESIID